MRKEAYKVLIAAGLGVATGLSACEATGITSFIPDSTSKNPNSTEPVVTPEGMGPYTSNYINILDPFLEKNIRQNAVSQGIELYAEDPQGFCVEYTGVASTNGKAEDCFVIFTDQAGTQNVFRKTWDGQNFGIEKLGIENITDPDGSEWTTLFDSEGNTVFKMPIDSETQFEQNGTVTAFITPEDGILGMMPTYDGNMFEVKVTKSAPHDALVRFKKELRPTLPQEVQEKFELTGIDLTDMTNAEYNKNGLSITLESGEVIVLTNTDLEKGIYLGQDNVLQYRGEFNDSPIYAYDKETGRWGVTPEGQLSLDLERWEIAPDKYNVGYDKDGKIEMREKGTNKLIYWDGKWSSDVIVKLVGSFGRCYPTPYVWSTGTNLVDPKQQSNMSKYMLNLSVAVLKQTGYTSLSDFPYSPQPIGEKGAGGICWGMWVGPHFEETMFAWRGLDGKPHLEQIFRE